MVRYTVAAIQSVLKAQGHTKIQVWQNRGGDQGIQLQPVFKKETFSTDWPNQWSQVKALEAACECLSEAGYNTSMEGFQYSKPGGAPGEFVPGLAVWVRAPEAANATVDIATASAAATLANVQQLIAQGHTEAAMALLKGASTPTVTTPETTVTVDAEDIPV